MRLGLLFATAMIIAILVACGSGGSSSGGGAELDCFKSARAWKDAHQKLHNKDLPNPYDQVRQSWHDKHGAKLKVCWPDAKPDKCNGDACGRHKNPA